MAEVKKSEADAPKPLTQTASAAAETEESDKPAAASTTRKRPGRKPGATKKETEKKTPGRKPGVKKGTPGRKPAAKASLSVQFAGKSYSTEELVKIAKDVWKYDMKRKVGDFKSVELFVKPEESVCYFVINGSEAGSFAI